MLFSILCLVLGCLARGDQVVQLDSKTYQKDVMDSAEPWVIWYFDSTMVSDMAAMEGMLDNLLTSVQPYGIALGKLDCADIKGNRGTRKLCMNAGIQTIPAVGFITEAPEINPYTNKNGRAIKIHTGDPTDVSKVQRGLISKNFPNDNIKSIKSTSGDIEGEMDDLLEEAKSGDALIYFNTKDSVSLFTKSICFAFSRMSCITVGGMTVEEISEKFGVEVESLPVLMAKKGDSAPSAYPRSSELESASDRDRRDVLDWVVQSTGYSFESEAKSGGDSTKKDSGKSSGPKDLDTEKFSATNFTVNSLKEEEAWVLLVSEGGFNALESDEDKSNWKKLVGASEGYVRAGELECGGTSGNGVGPSICKERDLPFMVMIPAGDEDDRSEVLSRSGKVKKSNLYDLADAGKAKSAALNSLPDNVNYIGEGDIDSYMMMNVQTDRMGLLVMSDKAEAPPMLRNINQVLAKEGLANLAFLSEPSSQFISSLNMPPDMPMPAVFMLTMAKENPEGTPEGQQATSLAPYDPSIFGPLRFRSIMNFIMSVYHNSGYADRHREQGIPGEEAGSDSTFGDLSSARASEPVTIASEGDWDQECGPSYRGICVLAFTKQGTEEEVASINAEVISKLGKAGAAFKFLVVDGPCQLSFAERFDVSYDMMPAYAIYSPSKGRTVCLKESATTEKVHLFLDAVLGGRATTYALAQRPSLSAECELDESEAEATQVEEEPMDDFLEEIRREEEERQAKMQKELKEEQKRRKEEEKKAAEEAKAAPKKVKKVIKKKKVKKSEL